MHLGSQREKTHLITWRLGATLCCFKVVPILNPSIASGQKLTLLHFKMKKKKNEPTHALAFVTDFF